MARVAADNSNKVILTSDNPRNENPDAIIQDMIDGLNPAEKRKSIKITDRESAIQTAILTAQSNDIILIAGKGHENYQEINGVKHPFDDLEIVKKYLS